MDKVKAGKPQEPATGAKPETKSDAKSDAPAEPYLGSWQTKEAAAEGLANLQRKLDQQGNELGMLRQQAELHNQMLQQFQNQPAAEEFQETPDYEAEIQATKGEIAKVQKQIAQLDPISDDYSKDLADLMAKSNSLMSKTTDLVAKAQYEKALAASQSMFKEELDKRDIKTVQQQFHEKNPEFNTPEMQARIKEYLAKDTTGMSDPLVAFREIQRDDAMQKALQLEQENQDLMKRLNLKQGTDATGTVITDGTTGLPTKQSKATGADLDKGMLEALRAVS